MSDQGVSPEALAAMTAGWASTAAYRLTAMMITAGETVDVADLLEIETQALEEAFIEARAYAAARRLEGADTAISAGLTAAIALFKKARAARAN